MFDVRWVDDHLWGLLQSAFYNRVNRLLFVVSLIVGGTNRRHQLFASTKHIRTMMLLAIVTRRVLTTNVTVSSTRRCMYFSSIPSTMKVRGNCYRCCCCDSLDVTNEKNLLSHSYLRPSIDQNTFYCYIHCIYQV